MAMPSPAFARSQLALELFLPLAFAAGLRGQGDWVQAHQVPPRVQAACAYDAGRGRLVVFGGYGGMRALDDTWELDDRGWSHRLPALRPSARYLAAVAYDAARGQTIVFGGAQPGGAVLGDQWHWDGDAWQAVTGAPMPPARQGAAIAYDAGRQVVVLFGGFSGTTRLADTWEWDGVAWTQRVTPGAPPARDGAAMAYDAARARCVLYGGHIGGGVFPRDTWEWDGVAWGQVPTALAPTSEYTHAMVFDPVRQRTVLFGGLRQATGQRLDETWEWNGAVWQQMAATARPTPQLFPRCAWHAGLQRTVVLGSGTETRVMAWDGATWSTVTTDGGPVLQGHAMAGDPVTGLLMLFGTPANGGFENWAWSGQRWTRFPSATVPDLSGFAIAADPQRGRIVLWGGFVGNVPSSGTWEWNGLDWQPATPVGAPTVRSGAKLAFDPVTARIVLFGGNTAPTQPTPVPSDQTWVYDGATWSQLALAVRPGARFGQSMATDPARGRIVLYGGRGVLNTTFGDTWEFDGLGWSQRSGTGPSPRVNAPMAYDPLRQRVVIAAGPATAVSTTPNETWEWDGVLWVQRATPTVPVARGAGSLGFALAQGELVLHGGLVCQGSCDEVSDSWRLGAGVAPQVAEIGNGCGGALGTPVLGGDEPYLGHPAFRLEVRNAPPLAAGLCGVAAATATTQLGGGCTFHLGGTVDLFLFATSAAGVGSVAIAVPPQPSLLGGIAYVQAGVLDASGPTGAFTLTPARRLVVGE